MRHICEDAVDELFDKLYPNQINLKSFEVKKSLNPQIWKNGILDSTIRKRLIEIAKEFITTIKIEKLPIIDIIMVGSSASYNWSKYSDIDLHILVDFSKIKDITNEVFVAFFNNSSNVKDRNRTAPMNESNTIQDIFNKATYGNVDYEEDTPSLKKRVHLSDDEINEFKKYM